MARIRSIKPEFFVDEDIAELSVEARLLFIGLWTLADREGRLEDRPKRLRAQLCPFDGWNVEALLAELSEHRFILRYSADGKDFLAIRTFRKHQYLNVREPASTIPEPDWSSTEQRPVSPHARVGNGIGKGKGTEVLTDFCAEPDAKRPASAPAPQVSPPFATLPTVGTGPHEYPVTQADITEWTAAYPGISVPDEVRRAVQWARDNPTRRKTYRGARRFLSGWLARAQDRAKGNGEQPRGPAFTGYVPDPVRRPKLWRDVIQENLDHARKFKRPDLIERYSTQLAAAEADGSADEIARAD